MNLKENYLKKRPSINQRNFVAQFLMRWNFQLIECWGWSVNPLSILNEGKIGKMSLFPNFWLNWEKNISLPILIKMMKVN